MYPPPGAITRHAKFRILQGHTKVKTAGKCDLRVPTGGPPLQTVVKCETPCSLWQASKMAPVAVRLNPRDCIQRKKGSCSACAVQTPRGVSLFVVLRILSTPRCNRAVNSRACFSFVVLSSPCAFFTLFYFEPFSGLLPSACCF